MAYDLVNARFTHSYEQHKGIIVFFCLFVFLLDSNKVKWASNIIQRLVYLLKGLYTQYHFEDFCHNQNMQGFPLLVVGQAMGLEHKMISLITKCANYFVYTGWVNLKNNPIKKIGKFSLGRICSTFSNAEEGYPDSLSTRSCGSSTPL